MSPVLADGPTSPIDQGVASIMFVLAALLGWVAVRRLRGRGFPRLPRAGAGVVLGLAVASAVLALVLPPILRPDAGARPSTQARLAFVSPAAGQVLHGDPASLPVVLHLAGGRVVPFTSTKLIPDTGHVHLLVDGRLVLMTASLRRQIEVPPGRHTLIAEFVAVDHRPFDPRVIASVMFTVVA
jgi:hypothetical protein